MVVPFRPCAVSSSCHLTWSTFPLYKAVMRWFSKPTSSLTALQGVDKHIICIADTCHCIMVSVPASMITLQGVDNHIIHFADTCGSHCIMVSVPASIITLQGVDNHIIHIGIGSCKYDNIAGTPLPWAVSSSCHLTWPTFPLYQAVNEVKISCTNILLASQMKPSHQQNTRDLPYAPQYAEGSSCWPLLPLDEKTPPTKQRKFW